MAVNIAPRSRLENERANLALIGAPPDIKNIVKDLLDKGKQLHVAFIFDRKYGPCETWWILMMKINSTTRNALNRNSDWEAFSDHLGIERELTKSIDNVQPGFEDPVTNTLLAFTQKPDPTLDKVISALSLMGRDDVLLQLNKPVSELYEAVQRIHSSDSNMVSSDSGFSENESCKVVFKPTYIPDVPCLMKNKEDLNFNLIYSSFRATTLVGKSEEHSFMIQATGEGYENDANPPQETADLQMSPSISCNFDTTVLLTFADDGKETALRLAKILRATTNSDGQHVGVVILEEQQHLLNADPTPFIRGVFDQVDYILPIITPGYLRCVNSQNNEDTFDCLDAEYALYIYKLMDNFYHIISKCINKKIRSFLPTGTERRIVDVMKSDVIFRPFYWFEDLERKNVAYKICLRKI